MSRETAKKIREKTAKLEEQYKDKPISWWADKLARSRVEANELREDKYYHYASESALREEISQLKTANNNLSGLLKSYGAKMWHIRITAITRTCGNDDDECFWGECDDCGYLRESKSVSHARVYDFSIDDGYFHAISPDFSNLHIGELLRVEDVTNPKRPVVLWDRIDNET